MPKFTVEVPQFLISIKGEVDLIWGPSVYERIVLRCQKIAPHAETDMLLLYEYM